MTAKSNVGGFPSVALGDPTFAFHPPTPGPPPTPGYITVTSTASITGFLPTNFIPQAMCPSGGASQASYDAATSKVSFTIPYGSPAINHSVALMLIATTNTDAAGNAISIEIPTPPP